MRLTLMRLALHSPVLVLAGLCTVADRAISPKPSYRPASV